MNDESRTLEAGKYTLVARQVGGVARGAIWETGTSKPLEEIQGSSVDQVYRQLETRLFELQLSTASGRQGLDPSEQEAVAALRRILPRLTSSQRAMLLAHAKAPECRITAQQLADAAGYAGYSAANLHYGLLGAALFAEMPEDLPRRKDGSPIMTCAIATGDQQPEDESQWIWKMRPHIKRAVDTVFNS